MINNKGQSALEYLMTYGWALVVIIIVIAALFAFGIFNPPMNCSAFNGRLLLKEFNVTPTNIQMVITNGTGGAITGLTISGAGCTAEPAGVAVGATSDATLTLGTCTLSGNINQVITAAYTSEGGLDKTEISTCSGTVSG